MTFIPSKASRNRLLAPRFRLKRWAWSRSVGFMRIECCFEGGKGVFEGWGGDGGGGEA